MRFGKRVEASSWVIDGQKRACIRGKDARSFPGKTRPNEKRPALLWGASDRFYQTNEDVRWNVFVAVDFEHPVTPRSASLVPGKRESALGAAKNRWQVARVPCTC
jgi:hypothetical protein